jgi:ABC-type multidrug transport system ATPase subunit
MELIINDLFKSYNDNIILKNISFQAQKGDIIGISGYNGAGKSTLIKCIFGFENYDKGNIKFKDFSEKDISITAPYIEFPEDINLNTILNLHLNLKKIPYSSREFLEFINLPTSHLNKIIFH